MLTRFAPSPTGYLHVGNIRIALICWIYARSKNGKFLLRFDDTDLQRSELRFIDSIIEDLKWIGIDWEESFRQSERFKRYDELFLQLIQEGYIYPCYETKEELEIHRELQLKQGLSPIYKRGEQSATEQRQPHFRFKLNDKRVIKWIDEIKGEINITTNSISDPIVKREDGNYTYMLPSVIDDVDFCVTNIVRGEDHVTNTAIQIQMIQALKAKIPTFAHLSLLYFDNKKISKRYGGSDIKSIKKHGIEPITLSNYLVNLGRSDAIEAHLNIEDLIDSFEINKFSSAPTRFSLDEVYKLNSKVLQKMSFDDVQERLGQNSPEFWYLIRNNIEKFTDVIEWWKICKFNIDPVIINEKFARAALNALPQGNINENTLSLWTKAIQQKIDMKMRDIFIQLRLIITGKKSGPELEGLLIFIGRENIIARLKGNLGEI